LTASPQPRPERVETRPLLLLETVPRAAHRVWRIVRETIVLATLFVFSLEIACRIEDWVQFRTPIVARERSQQDLLIRDSLGMHGRPGGRFQKWILNSLGMRGPEVAVAKPADVIRVVTTGASETFGLYESPGKEYPRQLEDTLAARFARIGANCPPLHAEVLNAAMPGMSLPTVEQDIRLRVAPLKPDFVVIYATPPQYLYDSPPAAALPDRSSRTASLPAWYALVPRFADRLRNQFKQILPGWIQDKLRQREIKRMLATHPAGWRFDRAPVDRLAAFQADLSRSVATIRSIGATPVLMTHANRFVGADVADEKSLHLWEKFYPRAAGRTIVQFDSLARLATIAVAQQSDALIVDLAPALSATHAAAFADYAHFNDVGAAMTAGALGRAIAASTRLERRNCASN